MHTQSTSDCLQFRLFSGRGFTIVTILREGIYNCQSLKIMQVSQWFSQRWECMIVPMDKAIASLVKVALIAKLSTIINIIIMIDEKCISTTLRDFNCKRSATSYVSGHLSMQLSIQHVLSILTSRDVHHIHILTAFFIDEFGIGSFVLLCGKSVCRALESHNARSDFSCPRICYWTQPSVTRKRTCTWLRSRKLN